MIADSARRHGVSDADMLHAFRNPVRTFQMDEDMTMPRSLEETLAHADELADAFEAYEPNPEDERRASRLMALRLAVVRRAEADRALLAEVADARRHHISWAAIGAFLGTSGEAARQRYGELVNH